MPAQEGQWDFAQKSRGHDWTCSSSRCATLPATTPLVLPTHLCRCLFGLFFLDLFEHKSESMQILLESLPICFQPSETWLTDQSPWLLVRIFFGSTLQLHHRCLDSGSLFSNHRWRSTQNSLHSTSYDSSKELHSWPKPAPSANSFSTDI